MKLIDGNLFRNKRGVLSPVYCPHGLNEATRTYQACGDWCAQFGLPDHGKWVHLGCIGERIQLDQNEVEQKDEG